MSTLGEFVRDGDREKRENRLEEDVRYGARILLRSNEKYGRMLGKADRIC